MILSFDLEWVFPFSSNSNMIFSVLEFTMSTSLEFSEFNGVFKIIIIDNAEGAGYLRFASPA